MLSAKKKLEFLAETFRKDEKDFVSDCSQIIDILQEIGGTEDYIKSFGVEYHYGFKCQEVLSTLKNLDKSHVIFTSSSRRNDTSSGHFHFINNSIGKCQDSYSLGWQKIGSNGFCQTFALMGALGLNKVFEKMSKEQSSILACEFLLEHNKKWYKRYWKRLCKNKGYSNIENLEFSEIKKDLETSMTWNYKDSSSIFWNLVLDETVYL